MIAIPSIRHALRAAAIPDSTGDDAEARARSAIEGLAARTPWFIRVLMGGGAWFGTWFLLAFFFAFLGMAFDDVSIPALVMGGPLVAAGLSLHRKAAGDFMRQLALVFSLTGQGLLIGGLGSIGHSDELAAVAAIVLSAALLPLYRDRVHRFFSTVIAAGALVYLVSDVRTSIGIELVGLVLVAAALVLHRVVPADVRGRHADVIDPVAAGVVVSLLGILTFVTIGQVWSAPEARHAGVVTTGGVTVALLWLGWSLFSEQGVPFTRSEPVAAACAILLLAAVTWTTPAILATLLVVVLAFDHRSRTLLGLAIAFFLAFGALYYYSLELTLLQKSGVLAGSGVVCLAAWSVLRGYAAEAA